MGLLLIAVLNMDNELANPLYTNNVLAHHTASCKAPCVHPMLTAMTVQAGAPAAGNKLVSILLQLEVQEPIKLLHVMLSFTPVGYKNQLRLFWHIKPVVPGDRHTSR